RGVLIAGHGDTVPDQRDIRVATGGHLLLEYVAALRGCDFVAVCPDRYSVSGAEDKLGPLVGWSRTRATAYDPDGSHPYGTAGVLRIVELDIEFVRGQRQPGFGPSPDPPCIQPSLLEVGPMRFPGLGNLENQRRETGCRTGRRRFIAFRRVRIIAEQIPQSRRHGIVSDKSR